MRSIGLLVVLIVTSAAHSEREPECYFRAELIGFNLSTLSVRGGYWLKVGILDPHSGFGIGTCLCSGYDIIPLQPCGAFLPVELYFTPFIKSRDCIWGRTATMVQFYVSATLWGMEYVSNPDVGLPSELKQFGKGKFVDIGMSWTNGALWTVKAGCLAASGTDYELTAYAEKYIYAALELHVGGWFVKEKAADTLRMVEKACVETRDQPLSPDTVVEVRKEHVSKRYSGEERYLVQLLEFGKSGKKEFYERKWFIKRNITNHFSDDPEFLSIEDRLFDLTNEKMATARSRKSQCKRIGRGVGGCIPALCFIKVFAEWEHPGPGADACAGPANAICLGTAVLGAPLAVIGGAALGSWAASILAAEDVSEDDIAKLNTIIEDYNTKVKHSYYETMEHER